MTTSPADLRRMMKRSGHLALTDAEITAIRSRTVESFITDEMRTAGRQQAAKLTAAGIMNAEQAEAEAQAWIITKAKSARMVAMLNAR